MNPTILLLALLATFVLAGGTARSEPVKRQDANVSGLKVDLYSWRDSRGRPRSVSLKKEGSGNPGHGGYAVQITYQVRQGGRWRNVVVNAPAGDGFGYFVSHERYRDFSDGTYDTIARRIFNRDDSPLGTGFAVTGRRIQSRDPEIAAHRYTLSYPRYGTVDPIPKSDTGKDVSDTPTAPGEFRLNQLPITITWVFQDGKDHPRIETTIGLSTVGGRDRVNFDVRGPYGVLNFDGGRNGAIDQVMWGDRFHFRTLGKPLTRNSAWTWSQQNNGARYGALIAGSYEMGLVEPRRWIDSALVHGYSDSRGSTSALYNGGQGCTSQPQLLPCDWEWPYQSAQYSLPYDNADAPTTYKKMAWGSAPYYGSGPSLSEVWDSPAASTPFNGFPDSRRITSSVCLVLGRTIAGGLTRSVAAGPSYNCAEAMP